MPPVLFFFLKIVSAIQVPIGFHINFRVIYSILVKNTIEIFIRVIMNLYNILESIITLTILTLPIH